MNNEDSGEFSDGLDEFEESADEGQAKKKVPLHRVRLCLFG